MDQPLRYASAREASPKEHPASKKGHLAEPGGKASHEIQLGRKRRRTGQSGSGNPLFPALDRPLDFATGLTEWLETLGLQRVGGPAAMVRGPALVRGSAPRQFALVSQAFG